MVPSPDTQSVGWKEAMAATFEEAAQSFDEGGAPDEATEGTEEADPADEAEGGYDADTDDDSVDDSDDGSDDDGAESGEWNGDPDTIPDTLKPAFEKALDAAVAKRQDEMTKGVQKYVQKLAEERQQLALQMQQVSLMQQQLAQQIGPRSPQQVGPPRPAEDAAPEEWDRYYDERAAWVANTQFEARMRQAMERGELPDPNRMAAMQAQVEQRERLTFVANLPGCTDTTMLTMAELAKSDPNLHALMDSNEGARTLFNIAKAQEAAQAKVAGVGKKAEEQARRGAQASKGAVPRPGGVRKSVENSDVPQGMQFRNAREKIEYLLKQG